MGSNSNQRRATRRTHSLGGCATCRRRHVKCDQVQPVCLTCTAIGATCDGYSSEIRWVSTSSSTKEKESSSGKSRVNSTRRHLYTEKSRVSMSAALAAGLGSSSIDDSLIELDNKSKDVDRLSPRDIAIGPFGVLNFSSTISKPQDQTLHEDDIDTTDELPTMSPSTIDSLMNFDDSLQWHDLFELGFDNMFMAPEGFSQLNQRDDQEDLETVRLPISENDMTTVCRTLSAPQPPQPVVLQLSRDVFADAHVLLKHFKDHVIAQFSSLPFESKSPWKMLNLSAAVQTLAAIEFLGEQDVKHASLANLYGVLACSAYHLASNPLQCAVNSVEYWEERVLQCRNLAKTHLQQSLRTEIQGQSKAKYKDQLMAILSLLTFSIMSGHQKDARCYMLDAERLLRVRGLAKSEISRKARLLHHIYTWIRIVGESTYVLHDYKNSALNIETVNGHSMAEHEEFRLRQLTGGHTGPNAKLDDFLAIESHQHDSDLEIYEPKEFETGLRDIHLSIARANPDTMYKQIYGIPETWLSLVSQTTRLANAIDSLNAANQSSNAVLLGMLQERAGQLENIICSYASRSSHVHPMSTGSSVIIAADGASSDIVTPNNYMLRALNSALVIFFYRRVRNVNPWILQGHIDDVIESLSDFDRALEQYQSECLGTSWPAFMAGCEAISPTKREFLMRWIEKGITKCGLSGFKAAQEMMKEVWRRRDEAGESSSHRSTLGGSGSNLRQSKSRASRTSKAPCTWVDLAKEQNIWLMLC